jgi:hypothetical protein
LAPSMLVVLGKLSNYPVNAGVYSFLSKESLSHICILCILSGISCQICCSCYHLTWALVCPTVQILYILRQEVGLGGWESDGCKATEIISAVCSWCCSQIWVPISSTAKVFYILNNLLWMKCNILNLKTTLVQDSKHSPFKTNGLFTYIKYIK